MRDFIELTLTNGRRKIVLVRLLPGVFIRFMEEV